MLSGIPVSPGLALAEAMVVRTRVLSVDRTPVPVEQVDQECACFSGAVRTTATQLMAIMKKVAFSLGEEKAAIFEGHLVLVEDEELSDAVLGEIREYRLCASAAVQKILEEHAVALEALNDAYQRARAVDIRDLCNRLVDNCLGVAPAELYALDREVILVARELTPSQTAVLDVSKIRGIITERGNITSHTAIMATAMGIPAIVGVRDATRLIENGDLIALDAEENVICINPPMDQRKQFQARLEAYAHSGQVLDGLHDLPAETTDGVRISLAANIGSPADIPAALANGACGVGLFRTEFLFMERAQIPSEDDLYQVFKAAVEKMQGMPVVIRILDVGGDKDLPYLDLSREENPFLGCRGIRLCFEYPEVFLPQLRALLRAGLHGDMRILVPMISSVDEVRKFKKFLSQARQSLDNEGILYADHVPLGLMIETPAAVLLAPHLIREVDFFSIGTNDLTQYTLAVDRNNERIADLYTPHSPAVLLSIQHVVDVVRSHGKSVCVCGQMAGDVGMALLLVGMGVEELSMSPTYIPQVKQAIRRHSLEDLCALARNAEALATAGEVTRMLESFLEERAK